MTYWVTWGGGVGSATVTTAAELDGVLDGVGVTPGGDPYNVTVVAAAIPGDQTTPPMVDVCLGHPDRAYVYHVGVDGSSAWGYEPGLEPCEGLYVNYGGVVSEAWPERTRVRPTTARQAAREFVTHRAQRPTCLCWDTGEDQ